MILPDDWALADASWEVLRLLREGYSPHSPAVRALQMPGMPPLSSGAIWGLTMMAEALERQSRATSVPIPREPVN
jgi:hypothetical protein